MNLANKITIVRIFMIPIFLIILLGQFWEPLTNTRIAATIFIIASATDALDGYIARNFNMVTNLGKFLDPLADKLLVASALIAMVELSYIKAWVAILIISREFIITGFRLIAVEKNIVIAADFWGKLKTVTQMTMVVYLLMDFKFTFAYEIGWILVFLSIFFTIISAVDYIHKNISVLKN